MGRAVLAAAMANPDERPKMIWTASAALVTLLGAMPMACAAHASQGPSAQSGDLAALQAALAAPGPDGKTGRETAVLRLVRWPNLDGHRILFARFAQQEDPEQLLPLILRALQQHLLSAPVQPFDGASNSARSDIVVGYLRLLTAQWRDQPAPDQPAPLLRQLAVLVLQSLPSADLATGLRVLLGEPDLQPTVLRCIADLQLIHLAPLLGEHLESVHTATRAVARRSLQLLTYHDEEFATRAQFDAWLEQNGSLSYVNLAERAARRQPLVLERLREERRRLSVESAVEFVRAHTTKKPGLDWLAISTRMLVEEAAVLDACLEQLRSSLGERAFADDDAAARQTFCKALLSRHEVTAAQAPQRRALLAEVAAYCVRPEETELAAQVTNVLLVHLEQGLPEARSAALRGLRRFPGMDVRARIVRHATALTAAPNASRAELELAVTLLAARTAPRWSAPLEADPDRADWLALVRTLTSLGALPELRSKGIDLALTLDSKGQRVVEVYQLLIGLAADPSQSVTFRSTCLVHLRGWLDLSSVADALVGKLQQLLADPVAEVRQKAADALSRLPELTDARRADWMQTSIQALCTQLPSEPDAAALGSLVAALQALGRVPQMAERAMLGLKLAIQGVAAPVPEEQRPRLEAMLLALATIAADPTARGTWLLAASQLLEHGKRSSLRLILQSHAALELAKDLSSADAATKERAVSALQFVLRTALLKPPTQAWTSSEELQREAQEVRTAFAALDGVAETARLEHPEHQLLRLEVELAGSKFQEAAARAQACLLAAPVAGRPERTAAQTIAMRQVLVEAWLGLSKPEQAQKALDELLQAAPEYAPASELLARVGRVMPTAQQKEAVALFERALRATPTSDPNLRARVLEWAQAALRADPAAREAVLAELDRHQALFEARECPPEQRDAFTSLHGQR